MLTGGVPAEYAGGSGLISKVVTKSGGDEFHGSINYYLQNDSLVGENEQRYLGGLLDLRYGGHPGWSDHQGKAVVLRFLPESRIARMTSPFR